MRLALLAVVLFAGCGTTRSTDTSRTATEQLLISDAVDRAVSDVDFRILAGKPVYFDAQYLKNFDDVSYLTSTLRQHLLASGCVLKEKREDAEVIVEARSGAVGTDRSDLLYGVPATNLGGVVPMPGVPTAIPEIPIAKRTTQRGMAKIGVFAYHRQSGQPIWQSGVSQYSSTARNVWVFGIGPFQSGTIYRGTNFAGRELPNPLAKKKDEQADHPVWVAKEAFFNDRSYSADPAPQVAAAPVAPPAAAAAVTAPAEPVPAAPAAPSTAPPVANAGPAAEPVRQAAHQAEAQQPPQSKPAMPPAAPMAKAPETKLGAPANFAAGGGL